jgi:hypothetical protein
MCVAFVFQFVTCLLVRTDYASCHRRLLFTAVVGRQPSFQVSFNKYIFRSTLLYFHHGLFPRASLVTICIKQEHFGNVNTIITPTNEYICRWLVHIAIEINAFYVCPVHLYNLLSRPRNAQYKYI